MHKITGFNAKQIVADVQFECMQEEFDGIEVYIIDARDHVEEIERAIRTVKECSRGMAQGFHFSRTPR